jgi:very-short-patch-repair endonuclease
VTIEELPPVYTRQEARRAGFTRAALRDDGVRVSRGVYVSRALPLTVHAMCQSLVPGLPATAAFSHHTAAGLLGAPVQRVRPLHVVVPPGSYRPRRRGVHVHVRAVGAGDLVQHRGLPLTSGAQTWLDLAASTPADELVAIGDALRRAGHLPAAALDERLARVGSVRGVVRARACAPLLTGRAAASRPESLVRYWVHESDLPDLEVQVPVHDQMGHALLHADLGYSRWRIAVEYEGRQHADLRQFGVDIDRYSLMAGNGWLVLRFGRAHLGRRTVVLDRLAGALLSRGARW